MAPWACTLTPQKALDSRRASVRVSALRPGSEAAVTPARCSCYRKEPMKPSPAPVVSTARTGVQGAKPSAARVKA